jgi:hypothetical protein
MNTWVSPRVRHALDQLATERQRLIREYQHLAASFEDGAAGRGKDSWLAAKHYEHFASYLAAYDTATITYDGWDYGRLARSRVDWRRRENWQKWRRLLRRDE